MGFKAVKNDGGLMKVFDLMLPKIAADVPVTRADIAALGEGRLCLGCAECHYVS